MKFKNKYIFLLFLITLKVYSVEVMSYDSAKDELCLREIKRLDEEVSVTNKECIKNQVSSNLKILDGFEYDENKMFNGKTNFDRVNANYQKYLSKSFYPYFLDAKKEIERFKKERNLKNKKLVKKKVDSNNLLTKQYQLDGILSLKKDKTYLVSVHGDDEGLLIEDEAGHFEEVKYINKIYGSKHLIGPKVLSKEIPYLLILSVQRIFGDNKKNYYYKIHKYDIFKEEKEEIYKNEIKEYDTVVRASFDDNKFYKIIDRKALNEYQTLLFDYESNKIYIFDFKLGKLDLFGKRVISEKEEKVLSSWYFSSLYFFKRPNPYYRYFDGYKQSSQKEKIISLPLHLGEIRLEPKYARQVKVMKLGKVHPNEKKLELDLSD